MVKLGFTCQGSKEILKNGGEDMLKALYSGKIILHLISLKNTYFL